MGEKEQGNKLLGSVVTAGERTVTTVVIVKGGGVTVVVEVTSPREDAVRYRVDVGGFA
jgi:hypothetical protein